MFVVGTAGHVDHGKSTLVKALTGIDPDRLQEEKERGMTIDLGFAWLALPSGQEISIVDVPGHERFIKNMLAGVGGIDLALLVVAADEGVMPQTKEHLAIIDLLEISTGIVVITKKDLVDEEWLGMVVSDIEETIQHTTLAGAQIVAVSATTGEGIPELLAGLDNLLSTIEPRKDLGKPRLPIDRIFTIAGFGTIVTGTLIDGRLNLGQEVEILPRRLRARIRGLQTHKHKVETAVPGSRVAVNIAGIAVEDIERGNVLTTPGWLRPTFAVDTKLRVVPDLAKPLRHNAVVTFHTGSSEVLGTIRLLDEQELPPGETGWAQVKLEHPVCVAKGDFFIVRSSNWTVGGGVIVDPFPKRHRRFHDPTILSLETLEMGTPEEILVQWLEKAEPVDAKTLLEKSGLAPSDVQIALDNLIVDGSVVVIGKSANGDQPVRVLPADFLVTKNGWVELSASIEKTLGNFHKQYPLRTGMPKEEVKSRLKFTPKLLSAVLEMLGMEGKVVEDGSYIKLPAHVIAFSPAQEGIVETFLRQLKVAAYAPAVEQVPDLEILNVLTDQGKIVRLADGVIFHRDAYDEMVNGIVERGRTGGKITVAEVRDMFNTSRKYAMAVLENLDDRKITRRVGDERVLRS